MSLATGSSSQASLCHTSAFPRAEEFIDQFGLFKPGKEQFRYKSPSFVSIDLKDKEGRYQRALKIKAQKIEAWWNEASYRYRERYRFVAMTLTFRDYKAYEDFERSGGRRAFMNYYKIYCRRQFGRDVIHDYVCVAEFQERGVIHYHYLLVVSYGVKLPFPDKSIFRWGMTNLKSLKFYNACQYLKSYIKKMKQLKYALYVAWKEKVGRRFRLYDFARALGNGILSMLNVGWGRLLYWRLLGRRISLGARRYWRFIGKERGLLVGGVYLFKAKWEVVPFSSKLYLGFLGFEVSKLDDSSFSVMVEDFEGLYWSVLGVLRTDPLV